MVLVVFPTIVVIKLLLDGGKLSDAGGYWLGTATFLLVVGGVLTLVDRGRPKREPEWQPLERDDTSPRVSVEPVPAATPELKGASLEGRVYRSHDQAVLIHAICGASAVGSAIPLVFDPGETWGFFLPMTLIMGFVAWKVPGMAVTLQDAGPDIQGLFRKRRLRWGEVVSVSLDPFFRCARFNLRNGQSIRAFGIQRPRILGFSEDDSAVDMIEELDALVAQRTIARAD